MPIFWQMFNGEKDITITAHHLAKEIDTGKIIKETIVLISTNRKYIDSKI